ncbi:hypothetical protein EDC14_1002131 [Hydrogenispora ethanolica]|uniref:Streptomycin adenylyltransferase n=1 Tax=Hydrogenispora ethanolica TaxID=1082276 RepID=A0A4R1SCP3_HYDET|nr:oxalate:formate antiporter [Hydrogenispora ethanolica]TCL76372.1 hypothetical protein EDC14_1002131 [Hydrogenispora ethanolica]
MALEQHREFVNRAIDRFQRDPRIMGIAAGGSWITQSMDEFSDIDLVIAVAPEYEAEVSRERLTMAEQLGKVLAAFTGEHVGEPRLLICLYGPPLLHVDLKFVGLQDLAHRVEDPVILWQRDEALATALAGGEPRYPQPDRQWIEDRFWVWVHYITVKIGRGELFEAIEMLSYLRQTVLGPLALLGRGKLPRGVRYLERDAPAEAAQLQRTIAAHNPLDCALALQEAIALYRQLREHTPGLVLRREAEEQVRLYLDSIMERLKHGL